MPKTLVPANANSMPSRTRRSLLADMTTAGTPSPAPVKVLPADFTREGEAELALDIQSVGRMSQTLPDRPMRADSGIVAVVADNVRRLRKAAKLSQEKLGLEAELNQNHVSLVERQKRNVTVNVLARLAVALKVEPAELVTGPKRRGR
jgi:ribosome-binding protein aMBF1 (putative translation factor)